MHAVNIMGPAIQTKELELPGMQGVIYAPFEAEDTVTQCLGLNLPRHYGKPIYPVIAKNEQAKIKLNQIRLDMEQKFRVKSEAVQAELRMIMKSARLTSLEQLKALMEKQEPGVYEMIQLNAAIFLQEATVLQQMTIHGNTAGMALSRLDPARHKLYVVGHGGAGLDFLAADEEMMFGTVTSTQLAEQLAAGGLPKGFRDIRITACHSADTTPPASFSSADLEKAAAFIKKRSGPLARFSRQPTPQQPSPFAWSLSRALKRQGFNQAVVTGYHGAGVRFPRVNHHLRKIIDGAVDDIRRSLAKRHF